MRYRRWAFGDSRLLILPYMWISHTKYEKEPALVQSTVLPRPAAFLPLTYKHQTSSFQLPSFFFIPLIHKLFHPFTPPPLQYT